MAWLLHFVNGGREVVYIAEDEDEKAEAWAEYVEANGYELSDEVEVDHDFGSWPTARALRAF